METADPTKPELKRHSARHLETGRKIENAAKHSTKETGTAGPMRRERYEAPHSRSPAQSRRGRSGPGARRARPSYRASPAAAAEQAQPRVAGPARPPPARGFVPHRRDAAPRCVLPPAPTTSPPAGRPRPTRGPSPSLGPEAPRRPAAFLRRAPALTTRSCPLSPSSLSTRQGAWSPSSLCGAEKPGCGSDGRRSEGTLRPARHDGTAAPCLRRRRRAGPQRRMPRNAPPRGTMSGPGPVNGIVAHALFLVPPLVLTWALQMRCHNRRFQNSHFILVLQCSVTATKHCVLKYGLA